MEENRTSGLPSGYRDEGGSCTQGGRETDRSAKPVLGQRTQILENGWSGLCGDKLRAGSFSI